MVIFKNQCSYLVSQNAYNYKPVKFGAQLVIKLQENNERKKKHLLQNVVCLVHNKRLQQKSSYVKNCLFLKNYTLYSKGHHVTMCYVDALTTISSIKWLSILNCLRVPFLSPSCFFSFLSKKAWISGCFKEL